MQKIEILLITIRVSYKSNTYTIMSASNGKPIIYSICVPRVFKNISEKRVRAIMYSLRFGFVERVDMVAKKNDKGEEFQRVFVHFSSWNDTNEATRVKEKLDSGEKVKVVYDNPWFWMISKSRAPATNVNGNRPRPYIDFNHSAPQEQSTQEQSTPAIREYRSVSPLTPPPNNHDNFPDLTNGC